MTSNRTLESGFPIATLALLGAAIAGFTGALDALIALSTVHAAVTVRGDRTPERFALQLRLVHLVMLVLGSVPPFGFLLWLLFAASCSTTLVGYCPLSRALSLMSWNRRVPFSKALLVHTFVAAPSRDGDYGREQGLAQQARLAIGAR